MLDVGAQRAIVSFHKKQRCAISAAATANGKRSALPYKATLARFDTKARTVDRPLAEAFAHRCRALLPGDDFEVEFDAAFERARTLLCYGERLRREKRRLDARERIREALDAFVALGATAWAHRAEAQLAATGRALAPGVASTRDRDAPAPRLSEARRPLAHQARGEVHGFP